MCTQGMPLFMHTGTPRKHVSRSWRVPGAGVGEKVILLLDCTRTRRGNKQQKLPASGAGVGEKVIPLLDCTRVLGAGVGKVKLSYSIL